MKINKYALAIAAFLCFPTQMRAQMLRPATWSYSASENEVKVGCEIELVFKVKMEDTWHLYSNKQDYEIGPLPTEIHLEPHESFRVIGDLTPVGKLIEEYDSLWEETIRYFKHEAEFRQKIKILSENPVIKGNYTYQVCTSVDGRCVPGDEDFSFTGIIVKQKSQRKKKNKDTKSEAEGRAHVDFPQKGLSHRGCEKPRYSHILQFPDEVKGYFDLDQALACARIQNKPLLLNFTAHNCTDCRKMEDLVWSDKQVRQHLNGDYVVATLYVDESRWTPEEEWYFSTFDNQIKGTIGQKNADYQITKFDSEQRPFYVLMDPNEQLLATPRAYNPNVDDFIEFLSEGNERFSQLSVNKSP